MERQETKSLPRNRKCGNCRYFEPAPLWRKGWCRNPRLYDRRANHLVDASSIDCEQVFRARIYWEPIPTPDESDRLLSPFNVNSADPLNGLDGGFGVADGGRGGKLPSDGVLRPTNTGKPLINRNVAPKETAQTATLPREKAAAAPNVVKKDSNFRKWLMENIPYYDKVDGPLSRVRWKLVLPWVVIFLIAVVILINLSSGSSSKSAATATPSAQTTATASNSGTGIGSVLGTLTTPGAASNGTVAASGTPAANASKAAAAPTATLSSAVPTQVPQATPTKVVDTKVRAKVVNTGTAKAVNMRSDPSTKDDKNIIVRIPEGTEVEIVGGPRSAENKEWWQVSYQGKTGWASKEFLQEIKP